MCINTIIGDHSKITLKTKNVLIESTATDITKVEYVTVILTACEMHYLQFYYNNYYTCRQRLCWTLL